MRPLKSLRNKQGIAVEVLYGPYDSSYGFYKKG